MRKLLFGFFGLIGLTAAVWAENPILLTVEQAVETGMSRNLTIQSSLLDYENSEQESRNRWNNYLPGISASAGVSRYDEFLSDETIQTSGDPWSINFGGGLSLPLGLTNFYSMESSRLGFNAQSIRYENQIKQMETSIRKSFGYLLASKENVNLQKKSLDLVQKRYRQAELNYQTGLVSELSVLQARNSVENLKPALQDVQTAYENQLMAFQNLIGIDLTQRVELKGTLDVEQYDLDPQLLVDTFLAGRLDVQADRNNILLIKNLERMTRAGNLAPSLTLSANWKNGISQLTDSPEWGDTLTLNATMNFPLNGLIPGSSARTAINSAVRSTEKSSLQLNDTMNKAEQEIRSLIMSLKGSWTNIKTSELAAELALKTYEMTEEAYKMGTAELLDVEDAQNKYLSANQDLLISKYNYLAGVLDLELALNTDMETVKEIMNNHMLK